jgi:hypothetical protein
MLSLSLELLTVANSKDDFGKYILPQDRTFTRLYNLQMHMSVKSPVSKQAGILL